MNGAAYAPHHHPYAPEPHHHMGHPQAHYYAPPHYAAAPMMPAHISSYPGHHAAHYAYPPYTAATHHQGHHYAAYPHPPPNAMMALPAISTAQSSAPASGPTTQDREFDNTGQVAPPGATKPKVTATLWEDEGTLCFQVEVAGICVARREDNNMINGTKLLNVAKMTRGRRDGILKSEKNRKVVKIGPMHLKGVWITYERALEFANKEKITEALYPLFVAKIDSHLAPGVGAPTAAGHFPQSLRDIRTAAHARDGHRQSLPSQPATMPQSTTASSASSVPVRSQQTTNRPGLDRAHTYSAPVSHASNGMALGHAGSSYEYGTGPSGHQHYPDSKSLPTTPAATPPENAIAPLHQDFPQHAGYDSSRNQPFSATSGHPSPYAAATSAYGYAKTDMGPPNVRGLKEGEGEANNGYEHDRHFAYQQSSQIGTDVSPRGKGSPHNVPGQSTPHSSGTVTPQGQWHPSYTTPQRAQTLPSTTLIYASGNSHGSAGGANGYPTPGPSQGYPYSNGAMSGHKRGRDADEDDLGENDNAKRRRAGREEMKPRILRR